MMQAVELPLERVFFPLGYPMRISTNSSQVLRAAEESWGPYQSEFPGPELRLRIAVSKDDGPPQFLVPVCRTQWHMWVNVADEHNFAISDLSRGLGFCVLAPAVVEDSGYIRYHFIEAMAYSMLAYLYLTPLHAGCVALNGRGILLFGPSGAGKSCLAFACAKRGWTYVSDDGSSLIRGRDDLIVIGKPYRIRFRESAADLFPELQGLRASAPGNGEPSIEIDTTEMPDMTTATRCRIERVVFLNRIPSGPAQLIPMAEQEALRRLESELPLFEQTVHEAQKASLLSLVKLPAVTLHYSDFDSALDRLRELLGQ